MDDERKRKIGEREREKDRHINRYTGLPTDRQTEGLLEGSKTESNKVRGGELVK